MAEKRPSAVWPFPEPGVPSESVGRVTPAAADQAETATANATRKPAGVTRPTEPDAAPSKQNTPSQGGSYTLDDASGEHTLTERTQQPEGCTRHLAPQPKE